MSDRPAESGVVRIKRRRRSGNNSGAYVGPGDVAPGALGWWGTHAYSGVAAGSNAEDVIRASDSTIKAFNTLATGGFDSSSLGTFLNATTGKTSKFYDQSGGGNPATQATDAKRPAASLTGAGSVFDGATNFLDCGNAAALNPTTAFTFTGWITTTTLLNDHWFFARDDNALGRSFALGLSAGVFTLQINGGVVLSGGLAVANTLYHVAVTGSAAAGLTLYLNGVNIATAAWTALASTTGSTTIGERTYSGFENFWNGAIDDVGMWGTVLSAAQIAGVYNAGLPFF